MLEEWLDFAAAVERTRALGLVIAPQYTPHAHEICNAALVAGLLRSRAGAGDPCAERLLWAARRIEETAHVLERALRDVRRPRVPRRRRRGA